MLLSSQDLTSSMRTEREPEADSRVSSSIVFRVCGGEHDGEMVRLSGRCCSVGSDKRCSLRLVSRCFQPLHLVIVRGPHGSVVKRWSDKTRLNGEAFDTAWLRPGDRLGLGNSFELELLEDVREGGPTDRFEELVEIEEQLQAALVDDQADDAERVETTPFVALESPSAPFPAENASQRRTTRVGQAVRKLRRRLQSRERQLASRRDELSRLLHTLLDSQAELARKEAELVQARKDFELQCQSWQDRTASLQSRAKEEQLSHERLFVERFSAQQHQLILMTQERDQLQVEVQRLHERVSALSLELETVKSERSQLASELELLRSTQVQAPAVNEEWQSERTQFEESLLQMKQQSEYQLSQMVQERSELETEFVRLREECELVAQQFETERFQWEQRELEYAAECDQLRRELLSARNQPTPEAMTAWSMEGAVATDVAGDDLRHSLELAGTEFGPAELTNRQETYETYGAVPGAVEADWSSQTAESSWSVTQEPPATNLHQLADEELDRASYEVEEPTFSEPSSTAPVDTAAILAKFGHFPQPDDEEIEPQKPADLPPPRAASVPTMSTRSAPRDTNHTEEERSIEDYMADLMRRVGSGPQETFRPAPASVPEPAVVAAYEEPEYATSEVEAAPIAHLDELRAQREKLPPINLSAMRDVANQTARVAINQHVSRLGMQDAYWKLFLAGVGGMTGIGLVVLSKGLVSLPLAGALVAFIVTGIWLYRGLAVYRVVRRKRQMQEANQLLRAGAKPAAASALPPVPEASQDA